MPKEAPTEVSTRGMFALVSWVLEGGPLGERPRREDVLVGRAFGGLGLFFVFFLVWGDVTDRMGLILGCFFAFGSRFPFRNYVIYIALMIKLLVVPYLREDLNLQETW